MFTRRRLGNGFGSALYIHIHKYRTRKALIIVPKRRRTRARTVAFYRTFPNRLTGPRTYHTDIRLRRAIATPRQFYADPFARQTATDNLIKCNHTSPLTIVFARQKPLRDSCIVQFTRRVFPPPPCLCLSYSRVSEAVKLSINYASPFAKHEIRDNATEALKYGIHVISSSRPITLS